MPSNWDERLCFLYDKANRGSIPLEQLAIMLIVPVGAKDNRHALRIVSHSPPLILLSGDLSNAGKLPLCFAIADEVLSASVLRVEPMSFANYNASSLSYGILRRTNKSANPIIPKPFLRVD